MFIEQRRQHADDARLGLPAQSQQDEIVARENRVDDLRRHGLFVADYARKEFLAALQLADQILPQLIFHAAARRSVVLKSQLVFKEPRVEGKSRIVKKPRSTRDSNSKRHQAFGMLESAMTTELPDMDFQRFWRRLQQLGLNAYEARSYLVLIGHPRFKALELAARAHVPRQKIYEVLDSLVEKGFAHVVQEKTKLFSAVEPNLAVPSYLVRRSQVLQHELTEQTRLGRWLGERFSRRLF